MSAGDGGWPEKSNRLRRRDFLKVISAVPFLTARAPDSPRGTFVNDVHTGWNPTWVDRVERPTTVVEVQSLIKVAKKQGKIISVSGSRHATGGQQFAARSGIPPAETGRPIPTGVSSNIMPLPCS